MASNLDAHLGLPEDADGGQDGDDESLERAAELIHNASSVSVFTGAGISVDSGIPDFRSPGGLWHKYDPFHYCNYEVFQHRPHLFWTMARELVLDIHQGQGGTIEEALRTGQFRTAPPNAGHRALVELEQLGKSVTVITQNIDGLHKAAGSSNVVELHGTDRTATCMACRDQFEQKEIVRQWAEMPEAQRLSGNLAEDGFVPKCNKCGGVLKADVTFFGEALPAGAMGRAMAAVMGSSVCLVVGTSLNVAPANMVPSMVKARFGKVIVCNLDESGRNVADVFIQGRSSLALPKLVSAVRQLQARGAPRAVSACSLQ
jgi:NAD-dependent deacetylase